jgi:DNA-binding GntR family transcriptional regulator
MGTPNKKQPAYIKAQQLFLQMLANGKFKSGSQIKESAIAKEFYLSRPAVREVLTHAVGWGILEYLPYQGYKVRDITLRDLLEWYEIREAIEPIAARRLADLRTPRVIHSLENYLAKMERSMHEGNTKKMSEFDLKFHITVINNCGNRSMMQLQSTSYFSAMLYFEAASEMLSKYMRLPNATNAELPDEYSSKEFRKKNNKLTLEQHFKMLQSIKEGKPEEAEKNFKDHAHCLVEQASNILKYVGITSTENPSPDLFQDDFQIKILESIIFIYFNINIHNSL